MKLSKSILLAALLVCCFSISFSQSKKALLFSLYPTIIPCTEAQLNVLFSAEKGEKTKLQLTDNFKLEGLVINKISKYNNTLQTLTVQLPAFNNLLLAVSKRKDENNQNVYIAHLYNNQFADGYQLIRTASNTYQFTKIETGQVLQPCNQ